MARSVGIFWLLLFVAPLASAEIFKCVGKDGLDLYQNFPCQFESMDQVPLNLQAQKAPSPPTNSSQPNTKPLAHEATLVGRSGSPKQREPQLGMTTAEVRAMWGEPTDTRWDEPGEGDLSELWSYGDSRSVRFVKDRVSAIQK
jgi:Domain of unknown function (DUF4124)